MVTPFGKSIVNNLRIAPLPVDKQIMLKVRFAELNRNAQRHFGVNLISTGAGNTIGRDHDRSISPRRRTSSIGSATTTFSLTDALNIFAFRPDLNLAAVDPGLANRRRPADSCRTEPGNHHRQRSELPGGW